MVGPIATARTRRDERAPPRGAQGTPPPCAETRRARTAGGARPPPPALRRRPEVGASGRRPPAPPLRPAAVRRRPPKGSAVPPPPRAGAPPRRAEASGQAPPPNPSPVDTAATSVGLQPVGAGSAAAVPGPTAASFRDAQDVQRPGGARRLDQRRHGALARRTRPSRSGAASSAAACSGRGSVGGSSSSRGGPPPPRPRPRGGSRAPRARSRGRGTSDPRAGETAGLGSSGLRRAMEPRELAAGARRPSELLAAREAWPSAPAACRRAGRLPLGAHEARSRPERRPSPRAETAPLPRGRRARRAGRCSHPPGARGRRARRRRPSAGRTVLEAARPARSWRLLLGHSSASAPCPTAGRHQLRRRAPR